jgi:hypothetical protein
MTGDAPQSGEHFPRKIQVPLGENGPFGMIGMAREHTQAVFEYKLKT